MRPSRLLPTLAIAAVFVLGAAFTAVAAPAWHLGAFAAAAAKPSPSPGSARANAQARCDAFVNDLAGKLKTSAANLRTQVKAAIDDQVDQAVKDGKLTKAQGDALKKKVDAAQGCQGLPSFAGRRGGGFGGRSGISSLRGIVDAAAAALKVTPATLQSDIMSGKTLQQVAPGMTQAQFDAAFKAALAKVLDPQVTAGTITSAQETTRINAALKVADALWSTPMPHFGGFGSGHRAFGRPVPGASPAPSAKIQ